MSAQHLLLHTTSAPQCSCIRGRVPAASITKVRVNYHTFLSVNHHRAALLDLQRSDLVALSVPRGLCVPRAHSSNGSKPQASLQQLAVLIFQHIMYLSSIALCNSYLSFCPALPQMDPSTESPLPGLCAAYTRPAPLQAVYASKAAANACRLPPNKPKKLTLMLKMPHMLVSGYQLGVQR